MELCDNGHDEVCYDSSYCPVCAVLDEIDDLKNTIAEWCKGD